MVLDILGYFKIFYTKILILKIISDIHHVNENIFIIFLLFNLFLVKNVVI